MYFDLASAGGTSVMFTQQSTV